MALPAALLAELEELVTHYPERRAALIPALHRCQEELGGWLGPAVLEDCAAFFGLEPVDVYGVATFYPMFRFAPPGRHVVLVCRNVSCDLRGAQDILRKVCAVAKLPGKGTSADGRFTVETVECQGACANAPMMVVDGAYHEDLDERGVELILGGLA